VEHPVQVDDIDAGILAEEGIGHVEDVDGLSRSVHRRDRRGFGVARDHDEPAREVDPGKQRGAVRRHRTEGRAPVGEGV
jgi:hypothetical protein